MIGFPRRASTSTEQGRVAPCDAFGITLPPPPETFPYGIYAVPEISTGGRSEVQAHAAGVAYECRVARFRETSRGHIMGEGATDLIHIGQAVINLKGTMDLFVNTTFNYPTLAEAYQNAGRDAGNRMGAD